MQNAGRFRELGVDRIIRVHTNFSEGGEEAGFGGESGENGDGEAQTSSDFTRPMKRMKRPRRLRQMAAGGALPLSG